MVAAAVLIGSGAVAVESFNRHHPATTASDIEAFEAPAGLTVDRAASTSLGSASKRYLGDGDPRAMCGAATDAFRVWTGDSNAVATGERGGCRLLADRNGVHASADLIVAGVGYAEDGNPVTALGTEEELVLELNLSTDPDSRAGGRFI